MSLHQEVEFVLHDAGSQADHVTPVEGTCPVNVSIERNGLGLIIHPKGTGVYDGEYGPIMLELYEGHLRLIVWNDINEEDPTIIDLEAAKESNRKPDEQEAVA